MKKDTATWIVMIKGKKYTRNISIEDLTQFESKDRLATSIAQRLSYNLRLSIEGVLKNEKS